MSETLSFKLVQGPGTGKYEVDANVLVNVDFDWVIA
jgi:hypothetical protein